MRRLILKILVCAGTGFSVLVVGFMFHEHFSWMRAIARAEAQAIEFLAMLASGDTTKIVTALTTKASVSSAPSNRIAIVTIVPPIEAAYARRLNMRGHLTGGPPGPVSCLARGSARRSTTASVTTSAGSLPSPTSCSKRAS